MKWQFGILLTLCVVVVSATALWYFISPIDRTARIETAYKAGELSRTLFELSEDPIAHNSQTFLLQASCLRQLGRNDEFQQLLKTADNQPEWQEAKQLALAQFNIQHGTQHDSSQESPQRLVALLIEAGSLPSDAYSVVVQGLLQQNKTDEALGLLEHWQQDARNLSQLHYLTAVHQNVLGEADKAETLLLACTSEHPQHELSWLALAELYARPPRVRFEHSRVVLEQIMKRFPHHHEVRLRLASIQRRLGKSALTLISGQFAQSANLHRERASVHFDLGDYRAASEELAHLGMVDQRDFQALTDRAFELSLRGQADAAGALNERVSRSATMLALDGQGEASRSIFEGAANRIARLRRLQDLNTEQLFRPSDRHLIQESQDTSALQTHVLEFDSPSSSQDSIGLALYRRHCATCHGINGNGHGTASVNINPPARNFRDEPMRLVSASNRLAHDEDLLRSIRHGIPGTSMPAFARLTDTEVAEIISILRQFMQAGLREQYARDFASNAPSSDHAVQAQWVNARSVPDMPIAQPAILTDAEHISQGKALFDRAGCIGCHAVADRTAINQTTFFDSLGRPVRAPNLAVDAFHGTDQPAEIYKRLILGIPGTPHPALATLQATDVQLVVAYLRSLRTSH